MINPSALLFWVSACLCPCLFQACPCLPSCLLHRHRATGWGCKGTLPFPSAPAQKKEAFLDLGKAGGWPHLDEKKKIKIILLLCSKLGMEWQSEFHAQDIALGWSGVSRGADGPGYSQKGTARLWQLHPKLWFGITSIQSQVFPHKIFCKQANKKA